MSIHSAMKSGHAPSYLREALLVLLDDNSALDNVDLDGVKVAIGGDGELKPLRWLVGQLWNCTDTLPGTEAGLLELTGMHTYAAGVRKLARMAA